MKKRVLTSLLALFILTSIGGCSAIGSSSPDDGLNTSDVSSIGTENAAQNNTDTESAGTAPESTETASPETEPVGEAGRADGRDRIPLNPSGYCAVGAADEYSAVILADTGAVKTVNYIGDVTVGLICSYIYDEASDIVTLSNAQTFPEIGDTDANGNDLSQWVMGAYPSSNSMYYGGTYTFSDSTPVFVRYSNNEWRLGHGAAAFASDGVTKGYISATGSSLNFVVVTGGCGSLETMKPADSTTTYMMDPSGIGYDHGDIMLDGTIPENPGNNTVYDENGLTVPDSSKERQVLIFKSAGGKELKMTLLQPTVRVYDKAPVFYIITGGGWSVASREAMLAGYAPVTDKLRANGFAVTSIDYRVLDDGVDMIGIISDCMDGIRYLSGYANEAAIDPDRIVVMGHSAGAHLALMCALSDQSLFTSDSIYRDVTFKTLGCVALSSPTVLYSVDGKSLNAVTQVARLFKGGLEGEEAHMCSPIEWISADMPPLLIATGDADDAVYPENTYMFTEKADSVGAEYTKIISKNAGHSYEPMNGASSVSVSLSEVMEETARFTLDLIK